VFEFHYFFAKLVALPNKAIAASKKTGVVWYQTVNETFQFIHLISQIIDWYDPGT